MKRQNRDNRGLGLRGIKRNRGTMGTREHGNRGKGVTGRTEDGEQGE